MNNIKSLLLIFLVTISSNVFSGEAEKQVHKLFDNIDMEKTLSLTINQMLDAEMAANPAMLPYKSVFQAFFEKYIGYEVIKDEMVELYAQSFTVKELKDLNRFYKTKTGKKTIEIFPQLFAEGASMSQRRIQENLPELQDMIRLEALRLETLKEE